MRSTPRPRLRSLAVAAALTVPLLAVPTAAFADDGPSSGDTVTGELVQAWPEYLDAAQAQERADDGPLSWVQTEDGDTVRVATEGLPDDDDLTAGATVEVTVGDEVSDPASELSGLEPARAVLDASVVTPAPEPRTAAAALAGTTDPVTVVMVRPGGAAQDSRTLAQVTSAVNGPVADFWREQSGGMIKVAVEATRDWITTTADCSDPQALWDEVATTVGWTRGAGRHLLLYIPQSATGCADGLAEVGSGIGDSGRLYVRDVLTSIIAHELGHNFGLGHSSLEQCDGTVDSGTCGVSAYDDWYDVMGISWQQVGSLNTPQAELIGLLPPSQQRTVQAFDGTATVRLTPMGARTGLRGLRLVDTAGEEYWLEYRTATGRDSWLYGVANWPGLQSGVQLRLANYADDTSLLLDGTPSAQAGWPSDGLTSLPVGTSVPLAGGEFSVKVTAAPAGYADVAITPAQGTAAIDAAYDWWGGASIGLGSVTSSSCGLAGGGCVRQFTDGAIYWSPATGARITGGDVATTWTAGGGVTGPLGYPTTDVDCGLTDGGCAQQFQRGSLIQNPGGQVWRVWGAIAQKWGLSGAEDGALGYPVADERCGLRGGGCAQFFENGALYWSGASGAHVVLDAVAQKWASVGFEAGGLGYPVTDTNCTLRGGGCSQFFQGGAVFRGADAQVHVVWGAIINRWAGSGWENGSLGYPVGDEFCDWEYGGCSQLFERGTIAWSPGGGARVVWGAIRNSWTTRAALVGLGFPTSEETCGLVRGGCVQWFHGGGMYWSPASGAHFVIPGGIFNAWAAQGYERGSLGYPIAEPGGIRGDGGQRFQGGGLYWNSYTGRTTRN